MDSGAILEAVVAVRNEENQGSVPRGRKGRNGPAHIRTRLQLIHAICVVRSADEIYHSCTRWSQSSRRALAHSLRRSVLAVVLI